MAGPEYPPNFRNERPITPPSSDQGRNRGPFFPRQKPPPPDQGPVPAMPVRR